MLDLNHFNSLTDRDSAFDYLCDSMKGSATLRRVSSHRALLNDKKSTLCKALALHGVVGVETRIDKTTSTITTGTWVIEINTTLNSMTMKLSSNVKRLHGID